MLLEPTEGFLVVAHFHINVQKPFHGMLFSFAKWNRFIVGDFVELPLNPVIPIFTNGRTMISSTKVTFFLENHLIIFKNNFKLVTKRENERIDRGFRPLIQRTVQNVEIIIKN